MGALLQCGSTRVLLLLICGPNGHPEMGKARAGRAACQEDRILAGEADVVGGDVTERAQVPERNHGRSTGRDTTHTRNGEVGASRGGTGAGANVPATQKGSVTYQINSYRSIAIEAGGRGQGSKKHSTRAQTHLSGHGYQVETFVGLQGFFKSPSRCP